MREKENNNIKKDKQGSRIVCKREKKKIPYRFGIHQSLCYMEWWKEWEKKKCPLHFTLKRVKVNFIYFYKRDKKSGERKKPKNYIFVGRGGEVDIVLTQPPWLRILDFYDHPFSRIQCNQSSKEVEENGTRKGILECISQSIRDCPMSGINVKTFSEEAFMAICT